MLKYPVFSYLVFFLLGFIAAPLLALQFEEIFWFSLCFTLFSFILLYSGFLRPVYKTILPFLWILLLGITSHKYAQTQYDYIQRLSELLTDSPSHYEIVITRLRQKYSDIRVYEADLLSVNGIPKKRTSVRFYTGEQYPAGVRLYYRGSLRTPRKANNFFEFDEESYFYRRGIVGKLYAEQAIDIQVTGRTRNVIFSLTNYRRQLLRRLEKLPDPLGKYSRSLILGDRYAFSFQERDTFFRLGIIHLFAISGLHVGIFYILIKKITGILHLSLYKQWFICLGALFCYIGLLGIPISALRVAVMLTLYIIGKMLRKIMPFFQVISITAFLFLLIEGVQVLWNLSFIFSFLATFGIVLSLELIPSLNAHVQEKKKNILRIFIISLVINLLTLPISFYHFNFFPWFQSLVNLVFVPLFPLIVIFLWGITLAALVFPAEGAFFEFMNIFVSPVHDMLSYFSQEKFFYQYYYPYEAPSLFFISSYLFLLAWYLIRSSEVTYQQSKYCRRARNILGTFALGSLLWFLFIPPQLEVNMPYIGQGQAVIISGYGKTIVYDCGPPKRGYQPLLDIINKRFHNRVDLLVLSHYHMDHVGNLQAFLDEVTLHEVWVTPYTNSPYVRQEILEMIADYNIPIIEPVAPFYHQFNKNLALQVIYPFPGVVMSGENDNSIVLAVDAGKWRILLNGDISAHIETHLLQAYPLDSDILFAGHHGSNTSSSLSFLRQNSPAAFMIQCGQNNRYGHPHAEVLKRADQLSLKTFRTDQHGQVNLFERRKALYGITYHPVQ